MVRLLMLKAARELNRRMAASSPKRTNRGLGQTAQVTTTKPLFTHIDRKFIGQLGLDVDLIVMRVPSARVVKGGFSEGQELGQMMITRIPQIRHHVSDLLRWPAATRSNLEQLRIRMRLYGERVSLVTVP